MFTKYDLAKVQENVERIDQERRKRGPYKRGPKSTEPETPVVGVYEAAPPPSNLKRLHSNIYDREALADFIVDEQRLWRAQKHFDRLTTAEGMRTKTAFRLMLATYAEI